MKFSSSLFPYISLIMLRIFYVGKSLFVGGTGVEPRASLC
jgi:hypothetical protein